MIDKLFLIFCVGMGMFCQAPPTEEMPMLPVMNVTANNSTCPGVSYNWTLWKENLSVEGEKMTSICPEGFIWMTDTSPHPEDTVCDKHGNCFTYAVGHILCVPVYNITMTDLN